MTNEVRTHQLDGGLPDLAALEQEVDAEYELDPVEQQELKEERALRDQMAQYIGEAGAKLYVYDMNESSASGGGIFIEKLLLSDIDHDELLERLRDEHGGGNFKLQIRNKNGHIQMNQRVSVVKIAKENPEEKKEDIAAIINAVKEGNNGNGEMIQMMMQQNQQQMQMMMQQGQQNVQMMTGMIQAIASKPEPTNQMGPQDIIAMMASMQSLAPKPTDPMDLFLKGAEFGQNSGGSGDENILQTAVKTLGGPIAAFAQAGTPTSVSPTTPTQNQVPAQPQQISPDNAGQLPHPNQPQSESQDMNLMSLMKLKPHLNTLLGAAQKGSNPELYAELLIDQVGIETVAQFIGDDEKYAMLFQYVPETVPAKPWFDQLRAVVIQWISEAQQEAPTNVHASGETGAEVPDTPSDAQEAKNTDTPQP